jgi:serine/threonine protein kinase
LIKIVDDHQNQINESFPITKYKLKIYHSIDSILKLSLKLSSFQDMSHRSSRPLKLLIVDCFGLFSMGSCLPPIEKFSGNPGHLRKYRQIPALSLLSLNVPSATSSSARAFPPPLPKLTKYPALENVDVTVIRPLPGSPLRPGEVVQAFGGDLVPLELGEILGYREIWYIGSIENKPRTAKQDSDYNDRKKQYTAHPNDHIAYRYQILSHAGSGAFSTVFRCFDHKMNVPVAVKIIRAKADCLQFAEIESQIQSRLKGSHSVRLLDSFFWRSHYCLSMELLFTDVYSIVERRTGQQLPAELVRRVTFQSLLCLRELSKLGIVHADIKPENILTNDANFCHTKVADFGTACYAEEQIFAYIQSRYYRAPEVLYGLRYGPPIDIWSLACVVYELLVGEPLFAAEDEEELAGMIETAIGPPPMEIYRKGTKWNIFSRVRKGAFNGRIETLTFMVTSLPRVISKFVTSCIVWNPEERMTPEQALISEWILPEWELLKISKMEETMKMNTQIREPQKREKPPWHN